MVLASKKNPCYFCDICGHFEALLAFIFFYVLNLVTFVILAIFVTQSFLMARKCLVTFAIFAKIFFYTFLIAVFFVTIAKIIC